jgi:hypothetical protein
VYTQYLSLLHCSVTTVYRDQTARTVAQEINLEKSKYKKAGDYNMTLFYTQMCSDKMLRMKKFTNLQQN